MKTAYLSYISLTLSFVALAQAKPLSYVGGTMAMQENDETGHTISLDYTFTPTEAFGLYVKQDENGKEILMITPQLNTLLKRWNLPDGQGNIFNMSGAGVANYRGNTQPALWTAFLADYESRRHLGADPPTIENEAKDLERDNNLMPLSGTSGEALAREIHDHAQELNLNNLAAAIAPRPVFVITANEGLAPSDHALAEALRKAGDVHVSERHWDTDHSYSGERAELSSAILQWAQENLPH